MHIAIAGNIGAGKTTLAHMLASYYGWDMLSEIPENNPYLTDFYQDMPRWAFQVQVHFLSSRFEQILEVNRNPNTVIQDRTIYEDAYVFARNLYESSLMTRRDYQTYLTLFESMLQLVCPPDLMIYLEADLPKLLAQIRKRGNAYEQGLDTVYLAALQIHYQNWLNAYHASPVLKIDVSELDFLNKPTDFIKITQMVDKKLARMKK